MATVGQIGYKRGRQRALNVLDEVCGKECNLVRLRKMFQEQASGHPLRFWKDVIMPLLPKESHLELSGGVDIIIQAVIGESGKVQIQEKPVDKIEAIPPKQLEADVSSGDMDT